MNADLIVGIIRGLLLAGTEIYEQVTGEEMTEEEFKEELKQLLLNPPRDPASDPDDWGLEEDDLP